MPKFKLAVGIFVSSLILSGCGINQNPSHTKVKPHESLPPTYFQNANSNQQKQAGQNVNLYLITKSLRQNYQKLFAVNELQNQSTIALTPTDKSVIRLIKYCELKNSDAIKNWHQFVHGVNQTSISVTKNSHDPQAKLTILDPHHHHRILYIVQNGHVQYDRFKK